MVETAIPHLGDTIGGKYRVERALGRGGMGAVFEVSHCITNKRFAIKWLMSEPTSSDDVVTRFVREAQVAGRCEHRNIVEVYDIDRHNGQLFMVMELLKGESLAERLMRCPQGIPYREGCRLLVPCIEAVAEAHIAGIIHRDLKPANIFICQARGREPEFAKVLDFGVSRFVTPGGQFEIGSHTRSGAIIGTPFYMPPEQMRGHPIDARADVYSMGVTLYETLAGKRPYDATSYGDLLLQVADAKPVPLSQLVPGLPRPLCDVVARAMATDPEARFASMGELARALEPFADMAAPHTPPLSWSTATQHTPLVSETPSFNEFPDATGTEGGFKRIALWVGIVTALTGGAAAYWTMSGHTASAGRSDPTKLQDSSRSAATSSSPLTSDVVGSDSASTTSPPTERLPASTRAPTPDTGTGTGTEKGVPKTQLSTSGLPAAREAQTAPTIEVGKEPPPQTAEESTGPAAAVDSEPRSARKKRQRNVRESAAPPTETTATTAVPPATRQAPSSPSPRPSVKRKARAPAHLERGEF